MCSVVLKFQLLLYMYVQVMKSFLQTQALENTCSVTNDIEPSFAILYIFVVESSRKQYVNQCLIVFYPEIDFFILQSHEHPVQPVQSCAICCQYTSNTDDGLGLVPGKFECVIKLFLLKIKILKKISVPLSTSGQIYQ